MLNVKKNVTITHSIFFAKRYYNNFPLKRVDIVFAVVRLQRVKGNMENEHYR